MKIHTVHSRILFRLVLVIVILTGFFTTQQASSTHAASTTPIPRVAIHYSELTEALESIPRTSTTPPAPAGTGNQWWLTEWHYFVAVESLIEALRSEGIPYVIISDNDITNGQLLHPDGSPKYPILFSLASEAVRDDELQPLRDYVHAGGFMFVGSSSFTRYPDGRARGNFALASEMGLSSYFTDLDNWYWNANIDVTDSLPAHRLVNHLPLGRSQWRLPSYSEEIPSDPALPGHNEFWDQQAYRVSTNSVDTVVLAQGINGYGTLSAPLLSVKPYGVGNFIYYSILQPLLGHTGADTSTYSYLILRQSIHWAFESFGLPVMKLSPWPYPYNAAFLLRHDFENLPYEISNIDLSAQYEQTQGVKGVYYFATGTLRVESPDEQISNKPAIIARLRTAVTSYGANIGSHNGGLANLRYSYSPSDYGYWHWGPDELLNYSPIPGPYTSGYDYVRQSALISFQDIEGWLVGLPNGRRTWAAPAYNSTREASYQLLSSLNVATTNEQKLGFLPHWVVSTQTKGLRYSQLALPISEWYLPGGVAGSMEADHTSTSVFNLVERYYSLGALINLYSHKLSNENTLVQEYITRNRSHSPYNWSVNPTDVYDWWVARSPVVITPAFSRTGTDVSITFGISGATHPQTAVEVILPPEANTASLEVYLNGEPAESTEYRPIQNTIKVLVGSETTSVEIRYSYSSSFRWGSFDSGGATTFGLYDADDLTPLQNGDLAQLVWVGPDGQADLPACNGLAGGDDVVIDQQYVQASGGYLPLRTILAAAAAPYVGDTVYTRAWNASTPFTATAYGQSSSATMTVGTTFNAVRWNTSEGVSNWVGGNGTFWNTSSNWVGSAVPTENSLVILPPGANVQLNDSARTGSLCVANGALLDLSTFTITAEDEVTNNGRIRQTRNVTFNGCSTGCDFLRILNSAGTQTRYLGVMVTPLSNDMGLTTVEIRGNQACGTGGTLSRTVMRCFVIDPQSTQVATIQFYYSASEANFNTNPTVYHFTGSNWESELRGSYTTGGDWPYISANSVDQYNLFALRDATEAPTAVSLSFFGAGLETNWLANLVLVCCLLAAFLGGILVVKTKTISKITRLSERTD